MKRTLLLIGLVLSALSLFAARQDSTRTKLDMDYRVSFRGGVMTNDLFGNDKLAKFCPTIKPTLGGEFAIAFHPDWKALHEWNDASVGVALSAYYLGNNEKLGYAIAPYFQHDELSTHSPAVACYIFNFGYAPLFYGGKNLPEMFTVCFIFIIVMI